MTSELVKRLRDLLHSPDASEILIPDLYNPIREAADRIEELERAQAWRPIETAPKDGPLILAWNGRWMEVAMWQRENAINPPLWRGAHCGVSHIDQPTHWLPLPQPPEAK